MIEKPNDIKRAVIQKRIISILVVFVSLTSFGQISESPPSIDFFPKEIDSIHFSVWDVLTKGMMSPPSSYNTSPQTEYEKLLKKVVLHKTDQESLMKLLSLNLSYSNSMALLPHHNLVFELYKDGSVVSKIEISTLTGTIYIKEEKNEEVLFRNSSSTLFGNYLVGLLSKYELLEFIDGELMLEGLGH